MYCPKCGTANADRASYCGKCGTLVAAAPPPFVPARDLSEDPVMRFILPVGRSGLAIAAGYAALFSFLVFPAPVALVLGILAWRDLKKNPKLGGRGRAIFALVIGGLGTALLAVLLVMAAIGH